MVLVMMAVQMLMGATAKTTNTSAMMMPMLMDATAKATERVRCVTSPLLLFWRNCGARTTMLGRIHSRRPGRILRLPMEKARSPSHMLWLPIEGHCTRKPCPPRALRSAVMPTA